VGGKTEKRIKKEEKGKRHFVKVTNKSNYLLQKPMLILQNTVSATLSSSPVSSPSLVSVVLLLLTGSSTYRLLKVMGMFVTVALKG
jgi:hypothetical protein